ncbi:MAG: hypothetical protein ACI8P9_003923 [Parasphingorhabdus sp.]|jgi:uncharacterized protein YidB (DUF937 family)
MNILQMGTDLLSQQLGTETSSDQVSNALSSLIGDNNGDLDISSLVSGLAESGGMGDLVSSWLGDGDNSPVSAEQLFSFFDNNKIEQFASALGIDSGAAISSLASIIPGLIDQSSSGGSLLDSVGGIDGVMNLAKKLF